MKKYKFRKYNKKYVELFRREKEKLSSILLGAHIEHIGSTAVEGLSGKGIIDIMISVPKKQIIRARDNLISAGYKFRPNAGGKDRLFFEKHYGLFRTRCVHLQLTSDDSDVWKTAIQLRDILRKSRKLRGEYASIKQEAVKLGKEGKAYRQHKSEFFKRLLK